MRSLLTTLVVLALANAVSGCAKGGASTSADPSRKTFLEVDNGSTNRMEILVVRSGVATRLGEVDAGGRATFELPKELVNEGFPVRVTAVSMDAPVPSFVQEIRLNPGLTARFSIPPR